MVRIRACSKFYPNASATVESTFAPNRRGYHPVVWSAVGGHASYAFSGSYPLACANPLPQGLDRTDSDGLEWQTWAGLEDAKNEPWYRFGGRWGVGTGIAPWGPVGPR